jgi:S-DNA-T family DNA segregation ATPase FtsK/SpoIIIE
MIHLLKNVLKLLLHNVAKGLLSFLLGFVVLISCWSYNVNDNSFNVESTDLTTNILGNSGAYLSDLLLQVFGNSSYLISVCFFYWGILLFKDKQLSYFRLKVFSLMVCLVALSVLLDKYDIGGAIGLIIYKSGANEIIRYIALLIFVVFLPLAFDLKPKISEIMTSVGSPVLQASKKLASHSSSDSRVSTSDIQLKQAYQNTKVGFNPESKDSRFVLPNISLLKDFQNHDYKQESRQQLEQKAHDLLKTLGDFGVKGKIVSINQGPVVTLYEFEPAAGTKSSRVTGLADDVARSLSAVSARISTISGRNALGIELPNLSRLFFSLKELIETKEYNDPSIMLPIILGKDLSGKPFVVDLAKMPHLLIAGTTGSGKSVGINTMILSLLYRYTPEECKFIMIDPKMLELSVYDNIPHLLTPVVTEASKAVVALKWAVKEMENRYRLMSQLGVRNITNFNQRVEEALNKNENLYRNAQVGIDAETGDSTFERKAIELKKMPFIVIVVDEMADLMLVAGKDIEGFIQRLAQMARAAGIHLITATQRPSVDVITGVIKANFPSRISFKVTSKIDSRTILGEMGSEQLLGMGDMLYMGNGSKIIRVHGPFVDDREVESIVEFLKAQGAPQYVSSVVEAEDDEMDLISNSEDADDDSLYKQAVQIVKRDRKSSTSYIQRCLRIGYNRAAILIERMEKDGIISEPNHSGKREIFIE